MQDAVANVKVWTVLEPTSLSSSFDSDQFAINNNVNITFELRTMLSSSFAATAKIQASLDASNWIDLSSTSLSISGNDSLLWTLGCLDSLMFLRVAVTITSGSSVISIYARAT